MSLFDDWDSQEAKYVSSGTVAGGGDPTSTLAASVAFDAGREDTELEQPLFTVELVEQSVSRGHGQVTGAAAANGVIVVVTSRGWFLRYDSAQGPTPVTELELMKGSELQANGIWTDPTGMHNIVAATTLAGSESFYIHSSWRKAKPLNKVKGMHITAVAWQSDSITPSSTGEMAIGTEAGLLLSLQCEEREKKDRGGKAVLDLSELGQPIYGLQIAPVADDRLLLLLSTPARLYVFSGPRSLEQIGAKYPSASDLGNFIELPPSADSGALACYSALGSAAPSRFAWVAGPGLYRGSLNLNQPDGQDNELDYLANHNLLPLPLSTSLEETLTAVAQTEYHDLLLYQTRLQAVNNVSQSLVQDLGLGTYTSRATPLGLFTDLSTSSLFLFTTDSLLEIVPHDEDRSMWKIHLEQHDFTKAFRCCKNQAQRDAVNHAEGSLAFTEGRFLDAARLWGKVTAPPPGFEEIALRFVDSERPEALQAFLLTKLDTLAPADKAQATMVATWLVELYLDQINSALLVEGGQTGTAGKVEDLTGALRRFLQQRVELLDVRTTMNLLASYGRVEEMMQFASFRQDDEAVLDYLVLRGETEQALAILRRPGVSQELVYKFSPSLMAQAPHATVDVWTLANPPLDPKRLLPALLRFAEKDALPACRAQALRFVQFCLLQEDYTDPAVHQLAVALYSSEGDEAALLEYLATARDLLGKPLYDPHAALRSARQFKMLRACAELLWQLRLFEEAVSLALEIDMQLATSYAVRPQEDEALQRKLWLAIACHVIQRASLSAGEDGAGQGIKEINGLMREAGGVIKIEDVLPLFPNFVQIDDFKEAICQSLEEYNAQIAGLKDEMDDATRIADALRKDVARLEQRQATLSLEEPCARCQRPVGEAPAASAGPSGGAIPRYFLFPTGNAFHGSCLAQEVVALAHPQQQASIKSLLSALAKMDARKGSTRPSADLPGEVKEQQERLRAEIGQEDPYNGELVIKHIDKPFILATETAEIQSWEL